MRLAQRTFTHGYISATGPLGMVGTKSHDGLSPTGIALRPQLQGKEVRWSSPTSSRRPQMVTIQVQGRAEVLKRTMHSAFGSTYPDDKQKSRFARRRRRCQSADRGVRYPERP